MERIVYLDYIKHLETFASFEDWEIELILQNLSFRKVSKNKIIQNAGSGIKELYYVTKGCLRIYYLDSNGKEYTRSLSFENNYCWAINFLNELPTHESISTLENSEMIYFSKKKFYFLVDKSPTFAKVYLLFLEKIAMIYVARVESLLSLDATERYRNLLSERPEIILKLPSKVVSSYLGITEQSLSRIKSTLQS